MQLDKKAKNWLIWFVGYQITDKSTLNCIFLRKKRIKLSKSHFFDILMVNWTAVKQNISLFGCQKVYFYVSAQLLGTKTRKYVLKSGILNFAILRKFDVFQTT